MRRFVSAKGGTVAGSEGAEDLHRRTRLIQGVEVDARDPLVQQIVALLGRPLDSNLLDGIIIVLMPVDPTLQFGREVRAAGQVRHPVQRSDAGDRHDAGDERNVDSDQIATIPPIVECRVVEEELRRDPVRAGIRLGLQVVELPQPVRRLGVAFGKAGDPDAESS